MMGVLVETDQSTSWIPPPKKKWIRHYLLSEVPKDYKTYAALQNSSSPPPITNHNNNYNNTSRGPSLPPQPSLPPPPPPAPKHNHIYHHTLNGVSNHISHSNTAITSSPPRRVSPTPSHYGGVPPHDGSYLAARLTAPPGDTLKNNHSQLSSPPPTSSLQSHFTPPGGAGSGGGSSSPGDLSPHDLKRRIGAGTREVHNKLEKNRRAHLKECFEMLRRQLPSSHDDKKPSNLSVLHSAIRYIQSLKRKERDYEHEMERLAREKIACQQRLSSLKKELSAQWDHIDFAALLPEAPPAPTPASAVNATTSARGSRAFDSDEDFEFEEIEEEIRRQRSTDISPQHSASTSTASERGHPSDVEDLTMSSRPGSSRDLYSSPPPPAPSLPRTLPPSDQPSPQRGLPMSLAAELMRNNVNKSDIMVKSDHVTPRQESKPHEDVSLKLETTEESRIHRAVEPYSTTKLHVAAPHLHLSPQLMTASGIMSATGTTIVGPAIQLLTTPSIRMLSSAHDQQQGGSDINVMTSSPAPITMANSGAANLIRCPVKPMNLSTSGTSTASISVSNSKLATLSHPLMNGSVITHAPAALHRPALSSGGNASSGTTVLTTMHGTPTVVGTHHLTSATGITHVVTAGTQFSALTPLVAGPVTMVTPGNHHSGVHILATGKSPFQVVSGPLLKTHQMVPQYLSAATTAQLVKPVMMVSSAGVPGSTAMQSVVPRASESTGSSAGGP